MCLPHLAAAQAAAADREDVPDPVADPGDASPALYFETNGGFCSRNLRNKCGQLKHFRGSQNALGTSTIGKIAELLKAGRGI